MDQKRLQDEAIRLETLLSAHAAGNIVIDGLLKALQPLLDAAKTQGIVTPVSSNDVPGNHPFLEGHLSPYPDLEQSYVRFQYLVSGREAVLDNP